MSRLAVYAIGGNALASPDGSDEKESALVLAKVLSDVVDLLEGGWRVVLTHGNGPQVGNLLRMDAESQNTMDSWVAATQGMIGHELSVNLDSILDRRHRPERTAVVLTRVQVDSEDKGFRYPTKPVGPVLKSSEVFNKDWDVAETKIGPRRVVASPYPHRILDIDVIKKLVELKAVVICGGGGGIPIIRKGDHWLGVPAVIDKDHFSSLLATELDADALLISTAIDAIRTGFGSDDEKIISRLQTSDAEKLLEKGEFPVGSMGPKVASLVDAVHKKPGMLGVICQPGDAMASLRGSAGTTIYK